jgi:O-antigen ligase
LNVAQFLAVATIAWGAFAFGAVYPWAYWPLAAAALLVWIIGLTASRTVSTGMNAIAVASGAFAAAAIVQIVPIPLAIVRALSPETIRLLGRTDLLVAGGMASTHAISIDWMLTATALALFICFAAFMFGAWRLFSAVGVERFAEALACIGVALALTGLAQKALDNGKIYGFWTPYGEGSPFGPFINRNHFAGWMLMGIPVTLGATCGHIARAMHRVKPHWRDRILWFASADASRMILLGGAAVVMALSLALTMSRGGMSALAVAIAVTTAVVFRSRQRRGRKAAAIAFVAVLAVTVVGWVGVDVIAARFSEADWQELNSRRGAWLDALSVARRFPVTGTGLNTYGSASDFYQQHDLEFHYAQAHNDYLQLAAEGGALLIVPAVVLVCAFVVAVRRRFADETRVMTYWIRVGAVTGLVSIALQETVDFSLQMPGNALLFAALCAIALHRTPNRPVRSERS